MKKIIFIIIAAALIFTSCAKSVNSSASVNNIMDKIKDTANFSGAKEEDIKQLDIAERYGIAVSDIEEGVVYYTSAAENIDKVILVKAKDKGSTENVERALGNEVVRLNDTWSKNESEYKKVRNHILKTSGNFVILIVCDDPKKIETVFDLI